MNQKDVSKYVVNMLKELNRRNVIDLSNIDLEKISDEIIDKLNTEKLERYAKSGGDFGHYGWALWAPFLIIGLVFSYLRLKDYLTKK